MIFSDIARAIPPTAVTQIEGLPFPKLASGKVREIFDLGDALLIAATDRLSAFDVILPDGIPGKGIVLTQMSLWWFAQTRKLVPNHLLPDQARLLAGKYALSRDAQLRCMVVKKLKPLPIECVVRGYLVGSGWNSYQKTGTVCGLRLRAGLGSGDSGTLSWRMLGVMAGLTVFTSVLVVIAPVARILKANLSEGLKEGGMALGESRRLGRMRSLLVVLQAAFAVILLVGAGLMVRTLDKLHQVDLGFDPAGKVKIKVSIPDGCRAEREDRLLLFQQLQQRLGAIPGVRKAAFGTDALLAGYTHDTMKLRLPDGSETTIERDDVSYDFLQTAGFTVVRGRWLPEGRNDGAEVVINETLAKKRFENGDPIGQMIMMEQGDGKDRPLQVVGVVRDIRQTMRSAPGMHVYCSDWWWPPLLSTLVLRMDRDPDKAFESIVRRAVYDFDPRLIVWNVQPVNGWIHGSMYMEELTLSVLKVLSGIALVLAMVGLFSVLAYTVDRRMSEFGVRLALGATPRDLARLVLKRGIMLAGVGVAAGTAGALGLTRFLQSLLFETAPFDPLVYLAVAVVLLAAAAASCWIPARRAARVDVARLLRAE